MGQQVHDITTGGGLAVRTGRWSVVNRCATSALVKNRGRRFHACRLVAPSTLRIGVWRDEASTYFDVSPDTLGELLVRLPSPKSRRQDSSSSCITG